jgi:O-antigen ligase
MSLAKRILFCACSLWLASQCILTFSRGGLYNLVVGVLLALPFLLQDPRARAKFLFAAISIVLVGNFVLLPRLESFTMGALSTRYEKVDTTGRLELVAADLRLWEENPLWGVGPGQAEYSRESSIGRVAAHTEFSRLLAEHGVFGFAALLLLLIAGTKRIVTAHSAISQAATAAFVGWSLFDMTHAGMRIAAPSFVFGLTYAMLMYEEDLSFSFTVTNTADKNPVPAYAGVREG